jgi:hypothetical protein
MDWITVKSIIVCGHEGRVSNIGSQHWVRVGGDAVLVDNDPEGRAIAGCPNIGPTMKPCAMTLKVAAGYSTWLRIGGNKVTLSNLDGLTDGTVPGTVHYSVQAVGQHFLRADS